MIDRFREESGATLSEVMVAMVLTTIAVAGTMGALEAADKTMGHDALAVRALAMAESRLEAKRSSAWEDLLFDDLDHDGVPEVTMHDDGTAGDGIAGDGIYSAMIEQQGVTMAWTVAPHGAGPLNRAGTVLIEAHATYLTGAGSRAVRVATLRANDAYAGN